MLENPDEIRRLYKQASPGSRAAGSAGSCPRCWAVLVDGLCWRHDVGCRLCGGDLDPDFACDACGVVSLPKPKAAA